MVNFRCFSFGHGTFGFAFKHHYTASFAHIFGTDKDRVMANPGREDKQSLPALHGQGFYLRKHVHLEWCRIGVSLADSFCHE
ncbi:hypothetical protein K7X08_018957 [Anisodus acutangulus]|uniref:Uncharacterized protein n=1 Tax=Anisodus acutangulus TaxID=402998 RepID=A0A9Q1R7Q6_9SOLA|nr:hypothetical protein K7X08_018957 [Anisodus acutangulus]